MLSRVQLFAAAWTVACQALLSMGFLKQEYWRGLPFPPPGGLLDPGINLHFLQLLHWQEDSLPLSRPTEASLVAQTVKNACNAGDPGSIPASGRCPGEGNSNPLQHSHGKSHGQRSLSGPSSYDCKESVMIDQLTISD